MGFLRISRSLSRGQGWEAPHSAQGARASPRKRHLWGDCYLLVSRSHTGSVEMGWLQPVMWSQIIPDRLPGFWKHPRATRGTVSRTEATFFMPAHVNLGLGDQTPVFKELVKKRCRLKVWEPDAKNRASGNSWRELAGCTSWG